MLTKRIAALFFACFLLLSVVMPTYALVPIETAPENLTPEPAAKIQETRDFDELTRLLGLANVRLYQMRHAASGEESLEEQGEKIAHFREVLMEIDARPSDELLIELGQAALIGDETVDVWGRSRLVDGYEVYELVIMDRCTVDDIILDGATPRYAATLVQDEVDNFELFTPANKFAPGIAAHFSRMVYTGPALSGSFGEITGIDAPSNTFDGDVAQGATESYRIFCDALTTVHFLYVRPASGGAWRQTMTLTTASVAELHKWYFKAVDADGEQSRVTRLTPDAFDDRTDRAIAAYEAGVPVSDCLAQCTATVTHDGETVTLFTLPLAQPKKQISPMVWILGGLGIVIVAGLVVAFSYGRGSKS